MPYSQSEKEFKPNQQTRTLEKFNEAPATKNTDD
jgi:hypothetical protein